MTHDMKNAFANGRGWYRTITKQIADLDLAETEDNQNEVEEIRASIQEGPLSVQVRTGWFSPGDVRGAAIEEYEILLSTGGPALRIFGALSHGEPDDAELQAQDWGTQWTRVPDTEEKPLLAYARCFYFGEG